VCIRLSLHLKETDYRAILQKPDISCLSRIRDGVKDTKRQTTHRERERERERGEVQ